VSWRSVILVAVGGVGWLIVTEDDPPWGLFVVWALLVPFNVWMASGPRRAVRLNSEPAPRD
jgi:hypothetical protein